MYPEFHFPVDHFDVSDSPFTLFKNTLLAITPNFIAIIALKLVTWKRGREMGCDALVFLLFNDILQLLIRQLK